MIQIQQLSLQYALDSTTLTILDNINLAINAGERVAIVGPSGSGKTSLLLLLAGLERPTSGSVSLNGVNFNKLSKDALADVRRDQMGIVFQSFHLIPSLNALENAALPLEIAGRRDAREQARALLTQLGLAERMQHYPGQLSGGEQQRVAIARALVHQPKMILADEPTGNLDDHTGQAISDLLLDLNAGSETTLILVTHDLTLAKRCDRILQLHDGRLHAVSD